MHSSALIEVHRRKENEKMTEKELAKMLYTLASMSTSNEKELNIGEMLSKLGESGIELEMFETPTFVEKMYFPIDQWSYEVFKRKHYINDEETSFWGRYKQPVKIDPKKVMLTSWPTWLVQELEKGETFDDNGGKISFNKNGFPCTWYHRGALPQVSMEDFESNFQNETSWIGDFFKNRVLISQASKN